LSSTFNNKPLTHGEEWYKVKSGFSCDKNGIKEVPQIGYMSFAPRMSRVGANKYYREKSRAIFTSLGYDIYERDKDFVLRLEKVFIEVRKKTENMLRREARKIVSLSRSI